MVAQMEAAGIERAILTCDVNDPRAVADMAAQYPGRFLLSVVVDPMGGMAMIRSIERAVKEFGAARADVPFLFNRPNRKSLAC